MVGFISTLTHLTTSPNLQLQLATTTISRNVAAAANDRLKRDEWSEGAVSCLLEAYEAKWTLRNRAKLKGQDWEDVAKHVSGRASGLKSAKTLTQCKNKIESMKKRYRSESAAAADASSWPLYPRLDLLLRGNGGGSASASAIVSNPPPPPPLLPPVLEFPSVPPPPPPPVLEVGSCAQNSHGSNDRLAKEKGDGTNNGAKVGNQEAEKNPIDETDSSTPAIDHFHKETIPKTKASLKRNKAERKDKSKKRGREEYWEIGESIRWLAEVLVRSEQTRMETIREIEQMRAESEAKRGEMDLKRTEIIANTQLQIAKLFAGGSIQEWNKPT